MNKETAEKIVKNVKKAQPEGTVTKSDDGFLVVFVKNTDIPLSKFYPTNGSNYTKFVEYFSDVTDLSVLEKFKDKQFRDAWDKMVDSKMPKEWCTETKIIEQFTNNPTYSDIWSKMKRNNLPDTWCGNVEIVKILDNNPLMMDLIESGFDVKLVKSDINELKKISKESFVDAFKKMKEAGMPWTNDLEVIKKVEQDLDLEKKWYDLPAGENVISIYKKIRDAGFPSEWYSRFSDFTKFINKSDLFITNWEILKKKKIAINDFVVFDKISSNDISLNNIDLIFDGKLNDDIIKILKSNDKLQVTDIRELVGDFEGLAVYSPYNFHRLYEGVKNMSLGLKNKLQGKAIWHYTKHKSKDFALAFLEEVFASFSAHCFIQFISNKYDGKSLVDIKEDMGSYAVKNWNHIFESSVKNAVNSLSTAHYNKPFNNFNKLYIDFVTGMNISVDDLIDGTLLSEAGFIRAMSGGILNICKNIIVDLKSHKSSWWSNRFKSFGLQFSIDIINEKIQEWTKSVK